MRRKRELDDLARVAAMPLLISGATLFALEAFRRVFRRMQLFCPTHEPVISWDPKDYGLPANRVDEMWIESDDGELLHAWYCRAERPLASGVYCHGNTGNLTNTAHVMPHLLDAGISVLLFDYRGFGRSTGIPSFNGIVADGVCAARWHEKIRPKGVPSLLYGFSLGGAIASQVIRHHSFDGLILQSTFTSLPDIAKATWPKLPLHLFAGNFFDTLNVVRSLRVPLLVIHGTEDEVCPSWMAHKLHDASGCAIKRLYMVDGGMHKDLFLRDCDSLVWAVNQFATDLPLGVHEAAAPPSVTDQIVDSFFRFMRRRLRRHPATV